MRLRLLRRHVETPVCLVHLDIMFTWCIHSIIVLVVCQQSNCQDHGICRYGWQVIIAWYG